MEPQNNHSASHFNSHAHVERDISADVKTVNNFISTHTLTWSVTTYYLLKIDYFVISTHTLTWSVTFEFFNNEMYIPNFNSHAHVERDFSHIVFF